jgi:two-component system, LytTR family, sensor kinase
MRGFSHDIRFRRFAVKAPAIFFHIIIWMLFIAYEISLAAAITKKFAHVLDYTFHYALYIGLFYYHCFIVLDSAINRKGKNRFFLFYKIVGELIAFFICSALISIFLEVLEISPKWSLTNSDFIYANIYRGLYLLGGSTAYRFVLNLIRKEKRINRFRHSNLIASMEKEKLRMQAEVALLKAQINPHMLFNTLNFLYNEIRKIDKPVADHIMSLSELMRYALVDINKEEQVVLNDELIYIEHYILLYKQRIPSHIILAKEGSSFDFQQMVIPLLLVTIAENILQHGDLTEPTTPAFITISCKSGLLDIRTENKIRPDSNAGHGIGLVNLQKRLQHAYPHSYQYINTDDGTIYKTNLKINLNKEALC